jgi:choline kinase
MAIRGIILAAGKGARLNGIAGDDPKCLVKAGRQTLIERQIQELRASGIDDIAIVVGYGADRVRRLCGADIRYIENPIFDRTNSLYSLWLARELLIDGFVVLNSDVLFHSQILIDLLDAEHEDALMVAYCDPGTLGDEEMKVRVRAGRVVEISKSMDASEADGENVGIVKFGPAGAMLLLEQMDALIEAGRLRCWAPRAFLEFALRRPLHAIGTRGFPWIEIDFPEDYRRAIDEVLPKISALDHKAHRIALASITGD